MLGFDTIRAVTLARHGWWAPIALAVVLRLLVGGAAWATRGPDAFLAIDSETYLAPAASLADGSGFRDLDGRLELFRMPGYPLLLAAGTAAGAPVAAALGLQLLLSAALVWRTIEVVERVTGKEGIAVAAGYAMAIEPTSLLWSLKVMPETLFALGLLTFVDAAIRYGAAPSVQLAAATSLMLAASAYVKPATYPLAVALATGAALAAVVPRLRPFRAHAVTAVVLLTLVLGAWHARNWRLAGYPGFTTQLDLAVYVSAGGAALSRRDGVPFNEVRTELRGRVSIAANEPAADLGDVYAKARRDGVTAIAAAPFGALAAHLVGSVRTLVDPGAVEYFRLFGGYPEGGGLLGLAVDRGVWAALRTMSTRAPALAAATIAATLVTLPYLLGALVAVWKTPRETRRPYAVIGLVVLVLALISGGAPGSSRLRVPMMPLLVVMAGCGAAGRWRSGDARQSRGASRPPSYTPPVTPEAFTCGPRQVVMASSHDTAPAVLIIVPVLDEAACIQGKVDDLARLHYPAARRRVVFVDGGSRDGTLEQLDQAVASHARWQLVRTRHHNKTAQLNAALALRRADEWVLVTDADSLLAPDTLGLLVARASTETTAGVFGVPVHPADAHPLERLHWRTSNLLRRTEARLGSAGIVTASCYLVRPGVLDRFPSDTIADDVHVACRAMVTGAVVAYVPASVTERRAPRSLAALVRHKHRKADAYVREIVRFLPVAGRMPAPARLAFLMRAALIFLAPPLLLGGTAGALWLGAVSAVEPRQLAVAAVVLGGTLLTRIGRATVLLATLAMLLAFVAAVAVVGQPFSRQTASLTRILEPVHPRPRLEVE